MSEVHELNRGPERPASLLRRLEARVEEIQEMTVVVTWKDKSIEAHGTLPEDREPMSAFVTRAAHLAALQQHTALSFYYGPSLLMGEREPPE